MSQERELVKSVLETRRATLELVAPLAREDWIPQSMPDASPVKWHLAHTSWFFERFVLAPAGHARVSDKHDFLFNSYYDAVGTRQPRDKRGLLTRPTVDEVLAYRRDVDARIADLGGADLADAAEALGLGQNHEEQHQELIVTDLKHLLGQSYLAPAVFAAKPTRTEHSPLAWKSFPEGLATIGAPSAGFAFDNERPAHRVHLAPFAIASRLVTTGELLAFVEDGGYRRPDLWLSDGLAWVRANHVRAPLYWDLDRGTEYTLGGTRPLALAEPACHLSYFEADAYARWAGARLPTEAEWEHASPWFSASIGDRWEWTRSAYAPYPGFRALEGAFGEYNGKFMVNQMVLRGASEATPVRHRRVSYRNFFPPHAQWQFSGIRLARDA